MQRRRRRRRRTTTACAVRIWISPAGQVVLVAFHGVQLLICKIRLKLFCCPHQSRQSLLAYWWPADSLLPQLPSVDTPTELREAEWERGREYVLLDLSWKYWSSIWVWDRPTFPHFSFILTHFCSECITHFPVLFLLPPSKYRLSFYYKEHRFQKNASIVPSASVTTFHLSSSSLNLTNFSFRMWENFKSEGRNNIIRNCLCRFSFIQDMVT